MIRVVIAEDHPEMLVVLRLLLSLSPEVQLVGEAGNGQEAVECVKVLHPYGLVIDVYMPVLEGGQADRGAGHSRDPDFPGYRRIHGPESDGSGRERFRIQGEGGERPAAGDRGSSERANVLLEISCQHMDINRLSGFPPDSYLLAPVVQSSQRLHTQPVYCTKTFRIDPRGAASKHLHPMKNKNASRLLISLLLLLAACQSRPRFISHPQPTSLSLLMLSIQAAPRTRGVPGTA